MRRDETPHMERASSRSDLYEAIDRLTNLIERHGKQVGELRERLDPLMRPSTPSDGMVKADEAPDTELAQRVSSLADALARTDDLTGEILSRLDLP